VFTQPESYREEGFGVTGNLGERKTAVILVTFEDMLEPTLEPDIYNKAIFEAENSINSYIKEISYNKTSLSGSVFGWYSLEGDSPCDYNALLSRVIESTDSDIDFSTFSNLIIITPQLIEPTCLYSAGAAAIGPIEIETDEGNHQIRVSHVIWEGYIGLNNRIASFTIAHELLHSFGIWHANSLDCIPTINSENSPSCVNHEYGNPFSILGKPSTLLHPMAFTKEWLGWLHDDRIFTATKSGIYRIYPLEENSNRPVSIRIPTIRFGMNANGQDGYTSANEIYVEFRQPIGFDLLSDDSEISGDQIYNGVLVYTWSVRPNSFQRFSEMKKEPITVLFDTTPRSITNQNQYNDFSDSRLEIGKTVLFEELNIKITTLNITGDGGIDILVEFLSS
tara:strand:- start:4414 stop:5592 length:1179 start_codon:yes stop_codon:yes gene_type:complete